MATNQIRDVTFRPVPAEEANEGGHALFLALDVADPTDLLGFLEDVVTRFKRERMAGPPDTRFLLITVIGEVSAEHFVAAWHAATASDAPAHALLGMLHRADVMQGTPEGGVIGQASLIATPAGLLPDDGDRR